MLATALFVGFVSVCLVSSMGFAWLTLLLPRGPSVSLSAWPSIWWLYLQVLISALTKGKRAPGSGQQQPAEVRLCAPTAFDKGRLRRFRALAGHKGLPEGEVRLQGSPLSHY